MKIHKEGIATIILGLTALSLITWLSFSRLPHNTAMAFGVACLVMAIIIVRFFRHPTRIPAIMEDNLVYAPADGKVVVIEEVELEEFDKKKLQVSIFMSPFNVHVNWSPVNGTVSERDYYPGRHLPAWHPKSSSDNERMRVIVQTDNAEVIIQQIAGIMARRIRNYLNVGEVVQQGTELGFIKLGSRVDIFLPIDAKIKVNIGDKVKGIGTVIAEI